MGLFLSLRHGYRLEGRRTRQKHCRSDPKSENIYLKLLVKLYKFLSRRTDSKFNDVILKRLCQSRTNKSPISVRKLQHFMKGKDGKIAVVVGSITNDIRFLDDAALKGLKVCALRFTETARARPSPRLHIPRPRAGRSRVPVAEGRAVATRRKSSVWGPPSFCSCQASCSSLHKDGIQADITQ